MKTNLEALKAGNITAKSQREYQIANPNIFSAQAKPGHKPDRHNKPPFDGPYGFVPKTGTEPLTHTIEGRYMGQGDDDADYPDIISIKKANKLPGPKPTKASQGHAVKAKEESPPKKHFCMKRFKNIKSRLNLDQ